MIQIICDEEGIPHKAGYSQHYGGFRKNWCDVNKYGTTSHPKVYVSKYGHASYFESGSSSGDNHQGNGDVLNASDYSISQITGEGWLNYQGKWGADTFYLVNLKNDSPTGPTFRHSKPSAGNLWEIPTSYMWIEPIYWYSVI